MKFAHTALGTVFRWDRPVIPTLVIEDPTLFRQVIRDIHGAIAGDTTAAVLSVADAPVPMAGRAELIGDLIGFSLNRKPLLHKVTAALEETALSTEHYVATAQLRAEIENAIDRWAFAFPCDITVGSITPAALLKAAGVTLRETYEGEWGEAERLIDYMELVREFERDKLFVFVHLRSWFRDETVARFLETALAHEYKVLLIDAHAATRLHCEDRLTVDTDLCEF